MANYKRLFLKNHSYFFTIVTYKRNPLLIDNVSLLKQSFRFAKEKFLFEIEAIVILPDHIHTIINLENVKDYPKIIGTFKRCFSKNCPKSAYEDITQSDSRNKQNYKPIWQKRYYEHTIRDATELKARINYIHYNPVKHGLVENVKDWQYSSFHKFVKLGFYDKNWCKFDKTIDFE